METLYLLLPLLGVLVHELGHALVALRLTRGPVHIVVGRTPGLIRFRLGRLHVSWTAEPARGTGWRGLCVFEAPLRPMPSVWIAAAGPIASLLFACGCATALALGHLPDTGTRFYVALAVAQCLASATYNGRAAFDETVAARRPSTDGAEIRRGLANHRLLTGHERRIGRALTSDEIRHAYETGTWPRLAVIDARGSVAPPGRPPA